MSSTDKADTGRRNFLKLAGTAAPAALAAPAVGGTATDAAAAVPQDGSEARLQDTAHTRAYFAAARF